MAAPPIILCFDLPRERSPAFHPDGDVAGLPLVTRTALAAQAGGAGRILLMGDWPLARVGLAVLQAEPRLTLPVEIVDGLLHLEGTALLLPAGLCLDRDLARRLTRIAASTGEVKRLTVGENEPAVWIAPPAAAAALCAAGLAASAIQGPVTELVLEGREFAMPARTDRERARATHLSIEALRKPIDGVIARHVNRHVSLFITRRLMRTRVRPNHVSLVTLGLGLAAALAVSRGSWLGAALGGVLLQVQSILDGVDGELARLKLLHSRLGEWLDTISDDLSLILFLAGSGLGVWRATGGAWALWVGGTAVGAMVLQQALHYTLLATLYHSGDLLRIPWLRSAGRPELSTARGLRKWLAWLKPIVKHDFYVFAFMVFGLCGRLELVLAFGVVGAVAATVAAVVNATRHLRTRR